MGEDLRGAQTSQKTKKNLISVSNPKAVPGKHKQEEREAIQEE